MQHLAFLPRVSINLDYSEGEVFDFDVYAKAMAAPEIAAATFDSSASDTDVESGYASATSSTHEGFPDVYFTKQHLEFINKQLELLEPQGSCPPNH